MTIKGEVTKLIEDPNFVNCTVKLTQTMPPSGTEVNLQLNSAQVEKSGGGGGGESKGAQPPAGQQPQPQHAGAKK